MAVLAKREGIRFTPFLSKSAQKNPTEVSQFSEEEEAKFATRFENGYDLLHDKRYNQWLSECHPKYERQPLLVRELFSDSLSVVLNDSPMSTCK